MNAKPYPKYKPSGVEWLGDVPEHWISIQMKWLARRYAGGTPDRNNSAYWDDGDIPWINSGAVNQQLVSEPSEFITREGYANSSARYVPKNALVMALAGQGKTKGMVAQVAFDTTCNQSMAAIVPNSMCIPRYLYWLLDSQYQQIRNMAGGEQRDGLNLEILGSIPVFRFPLSEQQAIADFLDDRTAKLAALLEKKRALIGKLREKRSALISRIVTKGLPPEVATQAGLNPNAKLKPSGIEWLGDIPEHWEVKKLSWLFSYGKGREAATLTKEYVGSNPGEYPVYSGQTANEGLMGEIDTYEFDFKVPVILVTTVGAKAMTTRLVTGKLSLSQNCALIIPRSKELVAYFYEAVLQRLFDYEKGSISLIMQPSLRFEDLDRFHVPLMSSQEQLAIASYLQAQTMKIDRMVDKVESAINTLTEYRTALITAAVTGKIDVRNVA